MMVMVMMIMMMTRTGMAKAILGGTGWANVLLRHVHITRTINETNYTLTDELIDDSNGNFITHLSLY